MDNRKAVELKKKYVRLQKRADKLNFEIMKTYAELRDVCNHDCDTEIKDDFVEGDYLNVSVHTKRLICTVCGQELDREETRGTYA